MSAEIRDRLKDGLRLLTPSERAAFTLRHVEGLSIEELAATFRLEKNNVSVRLHRIRLRLQTEMQR